MLTSFVKCYRNFLNKFQTTHLLAISVVFFLVIWILLLFTLNVKTRIVFVFFPHFKWTISFSELLNRGYYTLVRRYEFYFRMAKQYFTNECSEWVKYCFYHEKIKFISSSRRVMFFLLYRQKDIDKVIEGNYRNYVIDKLTCKIMENKPLGSGM